MPTDAVLRSTDPADFVREPVRAERGYVASPRDPARASDIVRLDMNESPFGPSPRTRAAIAGFDATNRYPDFDQWALRDAIAAYTGSTAEQIFCGAGCDDVLSLLAQATLDPGDEIIVSEPTFGVYRMHANGRGAKTIDVPLNDRFDLEPDAILSAVTERTKYIMVCSPNNPTGNLLDQAAIDQIVEQAPCLVAIDEAYAEFAGTSHAQYPDRFPNVIVFRTMSKFAGLAGLRVGYMIVSKELAPHFENIVQPCHNVSGVSSEAAIAALDDLEFLRQNVDWITSARDQLAASLSEIPGVHPFPSATNFLLVGLPVDDAGWVVSELAERGILVRHFRHPALRSSLRVTIGQQHENEAFLRELSNILGDR